jgi:PAS domain S-box-containing protein
MRRKPRNPALSCSCTGSKSQFWHGFGNSNIGDDVWFALFPSRGEVFPCPNPVEDDLLPTKQTSQPFKSKIRRMERPNPEQMAIPWEALSREKQKLQLLVEKSPFALAIIDQEGNYTYLNPKFTELFGYALEEIPTGRDWFNKAYTDAKRRKEAITAWFEDLRKYPTGETRSRVFLITCKDGSEKLILFRTVTTEQNDHFVTYEDITDRKKAEETLRESEEKYRTILENIEEGYYEVDLKGNVTFCNDYLCKIMGYPREELLGTNNRRYTDPVSAKHVFETFNRVYRTGIPSESLDWQLTRKDGSKRTVEISVALSKDANGAPVGFRGILRDVTEEKLADEALRVSEEKYRQLVNHAPAGLYEVDFIQRRFVTVNDVMCEYTGYTKEELLSMSPFDILVEESKARFMERITRVLSGENVPETVEFSIRTKEGKELSVLINAKLVYDQGFPKGARVVVHNITERKSAEQALRKSEERYRFLVDNANDAIFIAQDGLIKFPNPKTLEILGYSEDELVRIPYTDLVHPDDQGILSEFRDKREGGKEVTSTYSLRVRNRGGEEIWAQISSVPIVWEDRPATLNFVRDITIQKKAEEGLRNSLDKLRKITGATIQAMAQTVEVRDPYTAGHQKRVADLARAIATRMGLSADRVDGIRMAGVIHDIGKISVPAEILSKPGLLTPLEFSLIKTHSQIGHDILKDIEFPWDIATMVLQHHERLDGSGYPQGVTGERILLEARILTVADVVEAMASHRPYRPSLGLDKALEEVKDKKGRFYDPMWWMPASGFSLKINSPSSNSLLRNV